MHKYVIQMQLQSAFGCDCIPGQAGDTASTPGEMPRLSTGELT